MREKILIALKHSKTDYTEIRLEEKESTQVVFQGKDLENAGSLLDKGGVVRCLVHQNGWGVSTFNNLEDLISKVDQAYECAGAARSVIGYTTPFWRPTCFCQK